MARAAATDFMQSFRFHVVDSAGLLIPDTEALAGFNSVTIPEVSSEMGEYRTGLYKFTKKQPGVPTVADMTLSRGVAKAGTVFFDMILAHINGGEYRTDFTIRQYHVTDNFVQVSAASREYNCLEAFCIRAKPAGDLDATSSEISLEEVDIAMEELSITTNE